MWILALFIELIVVLGCAFYASKDFDKVLSENIEAAGQKVASFTYCIVITLIIQGLFAFALMPWLKNILFNELLAQQNMQLTSKVFDIFAVTLSYWLYIRLFFYMIKDTIVNFLCGEEVVDEDTSTEPFDKNIIWLSVAFLINLAVGFVFLVNEILLQEFFLLVLFLYPLGYYLYKGGNDYGILSFYKEKANWVVEEYIKNNKKDFKKLDLDYAEVKTLIDKSIDYNSVICWTYRLSLGKVFLWSLVMAIVFQEAPVMLFFYLFAPSVVAILAYVEVRKMDIKKSIIKKLEKYRCPFCLAPMSFYFHHSYDNNKEYFDKLVKRRDADGFEYKERQSWIRYWHHSVYQCKYCLKEKDVYEVVERRNDGGSTLLDTLADIGNAGGRLKA